MATKSIFIGSALESQETAAAIARGFAAKGYKPLRWWQEFPAGEFTFDTLEKLAGSVDGAIFVCSADDKVWYRGKEDREPRDNVILEYGLFVSRLGRQRTLIVKGDGVKLPSDLLGLGYHNLSKDLPGVVELAVQHFDTAFYYRRSASGEALPLAVDPKVVDQMFAEVLPRSWHQRCLYFGTEGARGWLSAIGDPDYFPADQKQKVEEALLRAIKDCDVRSFVSLGPGDALLDNQIARRLQSREPWLVYVPIDISEGLLQRAIDKVSDGVRVPVGVLTDFEERLGFIERQLAQHAVQPMLFAILGNTFGNLDMRERNFLQSMQALMDADDRLLMDVCVKGPKWAPDANRRSRPAQYSPGERRWLATGLARQCGESIEKLVEEFEDRIVFSDGLSDVPGTYRKNIQDRQTKRICYTFRRYDWEQLKDWLKETMGFVIVKEEYVDHDGVSADGVLLLRCAT